MDLQKSSAVVLEEEEASDSPASSVIQLESVCDNSTRSMSVSAYLGSDCKMEKNTSYDNHGFE
jgi:hypothetical protein